MADPILSHDRLTELFLYDMDTGVFTRKIGVRGFAAGTVAGCDNGRGYVRIRLDGKLVLAHRLAWYFVHKQWPDGEIDHINRNGLDNRITNLRVVSRSENLLNKGLDSRNTSGVKNVSWDERRGKWIAQMRRSGRQFNLGRFDTKGAAELAVKNFQPA